MRRVQTLCILLALVSRAPAQDSSEEKATQTFLRVCSACHPPENAIATRRTKDRWRETLNAMAVEGLKASDQDLSIIYHFLVTQYGRVNVNRAQAEEIAEVAGLSAKEAEAIIRYREETGQFDDFAVLAKVPGIDLKKLEKSRDAISF